jgi:plastocyanin
MHRRLAVQTLGVLLLAIVAGPTRADGIRVSIEKLALTPPQVSAHVGDTIQWVNADFVTHTATARNGDWDVMIPADPPRIWFSRPGNGRLLLQVPPQHDGSDIGRQMTQSTGRHCVSRCS